MSKPKAYSLTPAQWDRLSFGERVALDVATVLLWPLQPDERMTVLLTLLAEQTAAMAATEEQIDAIVDALRLHLKLIALRGT
jgi:hypothetical protein